MSELRPSMKEVTIATVAALRPGTARVETVLKALMLACEYHGFFDALTIKARDALKKPKKPGA